MSKKIGTIKPEKSPVLKAKVFNSNRRRKVDSYEEVIAKKEQAQGSELSPPYSPTALYQLYEHTSLLKPNVEAYSANIDLFGYDLVSTVPLGSDSDNETIREALFEDAVLNDTLQEPISPDAYTDEQVEAAKDLISRKASIDKVKADSFFKNCSDKYSFSRLRAETRHDVEITGNGYWECLRDNQLRLRKFVRVLPSYIWCRPLSKELWDYEVYKRVSKMTVKMEIEKRRVRTYTVNVEGNVRYLKEFGCRAVISSKTGRLFPDLAAFEYYKTHDGSPDDEVGNEIKHFTNYTNLSDPYGVPRWIGALIDVSASKAISDFNVSFFENGFMSPMAVLVSGGTLSPESVENITSFIEEGKGSNAHKVMVIEAVAGSVSDLVPTIKFENIRSAIDSEASFLEYDKRNSDKVGTQFRISDIVRGNTTTTANRATADAALDQADSQVFAPLRAEFDWIITEQILPALGLYYVKFVSRGHVTSDTEVVGGLILDSVAKNILRPNEARELLEPIFNRAFSPVDESWGEYPPQVLAIYGPSMPALASGQMTAPNTSLTIPNTVDNTSTQLDQEIANLLTTGNRLAAQLQGQMALDELNNL